MSDMSSTYSTLLRAKPAATMDKEIAKNKDFYQDFKKFSAESRKQGEDKVMIAKVVAVENYKRKYKQERGDEGDYDRILLNATLAYKEDFNFLFPSIDRFHIQQAYLYGRNNEQHENGENYFIEAELIALKFKKKGFSSAKCLPSLYKSAEMGCNQAQYVLGMMYKHGKGVPKKLNKSFYFLMSASIQGNADAQYALGRIYIEKNKILFAYKEKQTKNLEESFYWLEKSAEQENLNACRLLGSLYLLGSDLVEKNVVKGFKLYRANADKIEVMQCIIGFLYEFGKGVEVSLDKASQWYNKSAYNNFALAQYALGKLLQQRDERGTPNYIEGKETKLCPFERYDNLQKISNYYDQAIDNGFCGYIGGYNLFKKRKESLSFAQCLLGNLYQQYAIEAIKNYEKKSEICEYSKHSPAINDNIRQASRCYENALDNNFYSNKSRENWIKTNQNVLSIVEKIQDAIYKKTAYQRERFFVVSVFYNLAKYFFPETKYEKKISIEEIMLEEKNIDKDNYKHADYEKVCKDGYPREFYFISKKLKIKKNFTCEDCGVCFIVRRSSKHIGYRYYLHTHHINQNIKDNREENLRILCIDCHFNGYHTSFKEQTQRSEDIALCRKIKKEQGIVGFPYNHLHFEKGHEFFSKGNFSDAVFFLQKTAEQGHAESQIILSSMYNCGGKEIEKNSEISIKWCKEAAKQGHLFAQYILGLKYYHGKDVRRNYSSAARWLKKAAEQGHAESQLFIADMYSVGKGVKKNCEEALEWYNEASAQGHKIAQESLVSLEKEVPKNLLLRRQENIATLLKQIDEPFEV